MAMYAPAMSERTAADPEPPFHAAARDHHEAARVWREVRADPALNTDDLRRTLRADLCDLLLSDEWEARQGCRLARWKNQHP